MLRLIIEKIVTGFFIAGLFSTNSLAGEISNPLDQFLDNLESYTADFEQTLSNETGKVLEISDGIVYMQNPGKFRWVYKEPYSQIIVTDGETLWLYDEDLEQVTIRDISETIDNTPAAIISGHKKIDQYYAIRDMGKIEGFDWIELTPKDAENNQYKNVKLGFDKNHDLIMMVLSDNLGQITRIDFSNPIRNKKLDSLLFQFDVPEGVDVIDDRKQEEHTETSLPAAE